MKILICKIICKFYRNGQTLLKKNFFFLKLINYSEIYICLERGILKFTVVQIKRRNIIIFAFPDVKGEGVDANPFSKAIGCHSVCLFLNSPETAKLIEVKFSF